jgi:hypothetical protein
MFMQRQPVSKKYVIKTIILRERRGYRSVKDLPVVQRQATVYAPNQLAAVEYAVATWGELPKNKAYQIQEVA